MANKKNESVVDLDVVTRSLDLGCKVLAFALVGLIMSVVSLMARALFIVTHMYLL